MSLVTFHQFPMQTLLCPIRFTGYASETGPDSFWLARRSRPSPPYCSINLFTSLCSFPPTHSNYCVFILTQRSSDVQDSSEVWVSQVDIPTAKVLFVELRLCTMSFIFVLKKYKRISSWTSIVQVHDNVFVSHLETREEVSDLVYAN